MLIWNNIQFIPSEIGQLSNTLQVLDLRSNPNLQLYIPPEICTNFLTSKNFTLVTGFCYMSTYYPGTMGDLPHCCQ